MPLPPLTVTLTDGQKLEVLKRFRAKYGEELRKVETDLQDVLTACAEADFIAAYLGEQPEVSELRARKAEAEALERRRQHIAKILERLDAVIPAQPAIAPPAPVAGSSASAQRPTVRRY